MRFISMILVVATLLSTALIGLIPVVESFTPSGSISMVGVTPLDSMRHASAAASVNRTVHSQRLKSANHTREHHHSIFANHSAHVVHANHTTDASIAARQTTTLTWYAAVARDMHNWYRWYNSDTNYVEWSSDLARKAWILADTCKFHHVMDIGGGGYGQNIAYDGTNVMTGYEDPIDFLFKHIDEWYFEFPAYTNYYNLESPPLPDEPNQFLHYTQIAWKDVTHVGCHTAFCPAAGTPPNTPGDFYYPGFYTVCNYSPPGNILGSFKENVSPPDPRDDGPIDHYPYDSRVKGDPRWTGKWGSE